MYRLWVISFIILLAGIAGYFNLRTIDVDPANVGSVTHVSQLKVKSLDGEPYKIGRLNKKPLIMNVWATWCAPCIKELPSLMALDRQGKYSVVAVAIDKDPIVIKNFLRQHGFNEMPALWDKNGEAIKEKIGLRGIPTTFIIDTKQNIVGIEQGERDWNHPKMIENIEFYLKAAQTKTNN